MVDSVQGFDPPPHPSYPRDWLEWDSYYTLHLSYMRTLERKGVVHGDSLSFVQIRDGAHLVSVHIYGRIECSTGVTINVEKWLEADGSRVRGLEYSYQAFVEEPEHRDILRYDNAHGPLHRHFFDSHGVDVGQQTLGFEDFPTLDQVIREAVRLAGG